MIDRDIYLNKLIDKMHGDRIKIITGVRRCGKSYLLKKIFVEYLKSIGVKDNQIIIVELDDDRFEELRDKKLLRQYVENKAGGEGRYYIIIDEVQDFTQINLKLIKQIAPIMIVFSAILILLIRLNINSYMIHYKELIQLMKSMAYYQLKTLK